MNELAIVVAGETLMLHAERALWWPRRRSLLVADVHLGKGSVLRRAGLAVPTGQTMQDLLRLDRLIAHYRPIQLIVLGDLVHGPAPADSAWIAQVNDWRGSHAEIAMNLVAGNHDRHFDARGLGFEVVEDQWTLEPFTLRHAPCHVDGSYVLAGHVHPGIAVQDGWRRHRLPAFRFGAHGGLLPAFGALTGLHLTPVARDEQVVAVTPAGLVELPRAR
jgi:uncharacterized protein